MSKTSNAKPRADNPLKGIHVFKAKGETFILKMQWPEIMAIEAAFPNGYNPSRVTDLCKILAILMAEYQPEMDENALQELSLPVLPVIKAITTVTNYAYDGKDDGSKADEAKANGKDPASGNPPVTEPEAVSSAL